MTCLSSVEPDGLSSFVMSNSPTRHDVNVTEKLHGTIRERDVSPAGPNPVRHDFYFGDHLTGALETLRTPNSWCIDCGGRLTAICPDCTSGACWFCDRHKECLNFEMCGWEVKGRLLVSPPSWSVWVDFILVSQGLWPDSQYSCDVDQHARSHGVCHWCSGNP